MLSDAAIGESGRNVRCRACGHSWMAKPPHVLETESVVEDESGLTRAQVERLRLKAQSNAEGRTGPHAEIREKERQRRKRNRLIAASAAWAICATTFTGVAAATVLYREKVVEIWPKTASIYAMAGMGVNRFGLEFTDLETRRSFDGTTPILTVTGKVSNIADKHRVAPLVRIMLTSETGDMVHEESVNLFDDVIAPGAQSGFSAHILSPPMDSYQLAVEFEASGRDMPAQIHAPQDDGSDHATPGHAAPDHGEAHHEPALDTPDHDESQDYGDEHAPVIDHGSDQDDEMTGDTHAENTHGPQADETSDPHGTDPDDGHH